MVRIRIAVGGIFDACPYKKGSSTVCMERCAAASPMPPKLAHRHIVIEFVRSLWYSKQTEKLVLDEVSS